MKMNNVLRSFFTKQYARFINNSKIIAIFGSVGKSTSLECCRAVLSQKFKIITINNPNLKATLRIIPKVGKELVEFNMTNPQELNLYKNIFKPQTVIVTRIFNQSDFAREIVEILDRDSLAILNYDDPNVRRLSEDIKSQVLFYGSDSDNCQMWVSNKRIINLKTVFELNYGVERVEVTSNLLGFHHIYGSLAAASLGVSLDIPLLTIKKGLEEVPVLESRMQALDGVNGSVVIDDTYNNSFLSLESALECLNHISARRRIVVLGPMEDLGDSSEKLHREIARKIYRDKIDLIFLGEGESKFIEDELSKLGFINERVQLFQKPPQIVSKLLKILARGDVVLIKGVLTARLNEVVKRITKKRL